MTLRPQRYRFLFATTTLACLCEIACSAQSDPMPGETSTPLPASPDSTEPRGGSDNTDDSSDDSSDETEDPTKNATDTGNTDTTGGTSTVEEDPIEDPIEFSGEMNGYRWELPCKDPNQRNTCKWDPSLYDGAIENPSVTLHRETLVTFGGDPDVIYDVEIRIRGLSEPKNFTGGEVLYDHFQIGGMAKSDDYNIYAIHVAEPQNDYTLNRHEKNTNHFTFVLDYTVSIQIRGGSEVRLTMIDPNTEAIANPGGNIASGEPFVVPDIPPFPEPFYGQFIQMDVLSVAPSF